MTLLKSNSLEFELNSGRICSPNPEGLDPLQPLTTTALVLLRHQALAEMHTLGWMGLQSQSQADCSSAGYSSAATQRLHCRHLWGGTRQSGPKGGKGHGCDALD